MMATIIVIRVITMIRRRRRRNVQEATCKEEKERSVGKK
jgi:hypothetical protein